MCAWPSLAPLVSTSARRSSSIVADAYDGLNQCFRFYHYARSHQALSYQAPAQAHGMAS